jgi:hypothetical protein
VSRRLAWLAAALCIAAGAALRAIPCANDFWLDEIWTWNAARGLDSPLGVFTRLHDSNNHHLNTLLFYALGDQAHRAVYRLPSLLAGVASLGLAGALGARRGRLEGVLATLLASGSFALVHFSSEARGYALAVAFALGATLALLRFLDSRRALPAALFSLCAVLGILSHLVWVFFWCGAIACSAWRLARGAEPRRAALLALARLHAAPAAALALLWWVDLRWLRIGGGPETDAALEVARTVGFSLGLPVLPALAPLYAALALCILGLGLRLLGRDRDGLWLLFLVAIALAPATILALARPEVIAVRYFLIGIALLLVLFAWLLADALRAGGARRVAAALALGAFLAGNGLHVARFLELGRGGYRAALLYMAAHDGAAAIRVGSDHDFRNAMVLRFYARELPPGRRVIYVSRREWAASPPEWLVVHRGVRPAHPDPELTVAGAGRYRLAAEFAHAAISGFWWGLYRRSGSGAPQDHEPEAPRAERLGPDPRHALVVRVDPGAQPPPIARVAAERADAELLVAPMREHDEVRRMARQVREHRPLAEGRDLRRQKQKITGRIPSS